MVTFSIFAGVLSFALQITPIVTGYPEGEPEEVRQFVMINQATYSVAKTEAIVVIGELAPKPQNPETGVQFVKMKEGDAKDGYIQHHPAPT